MSVTLTNRESSYIEQLLNQSTGRHDRSVSKMAKIIQRLDYWINIVEKKHKLSKGTPIRKDE